MSKYRHISLFCLAIFLVSCQPELPQDVQQAYQALEEEVDFSTLVKPLLSDRCFACHGNDKDKLEAGLRLDNSEGAYGALPDSPGKQAIAPHQLRKSEVFHRILSDDPDYQMPPPHANLFLNAREKAILIKWIEEGAEYKEHWSFISPDSIIQPPLVGDPSWAINDIDQFTYHKMVAQKLTPAESADRATLLRRLSFDLTGLPPTVDELESFLNDQSTSAYEKQIDRLLQSAHYGERMAVDWLDLARFADTHGYLADRYRDMSPWRDWIIKAFNKNMPYDQFVTWQLAGDLLPDATREQILATGFNRLHQQNAEDGIIDEEFRVAYVADRTEVFGVGLMGLSLGCAKCHDHKYDPISQKNYYELYSFFNNINEAGLISWEGATPVPSLLLPTDAQSTFLGKQEIKMSKQEEKLDSLADAQQEAIQKWIEENTYSKLKINARLPGMVAHFELENTRLKNSLNPTQKANMDRRFSNVESPHLVPGKKGRGLKLDGDAWLDLGEIGIFKRNQPFTIALHAFIPQNLSDGVIFHKGYGTGLHAYRGFHLRIKDHAFELMMAHTYPDNAINEIFDCVIPREEWIHLAVSYDGSSRADGLHLYLNGEKLPSQIEIDNLYKDIIFHNLVDPIYPEPIEPGIQFGGRWRGTGLRNGMIDELMVFDRELSALEILRLGNQTSLDSLLTSPSRLLSEGQKQNLRRHYLHREVPEYARQLEILQQVRGRYVDSIEKVQEVMVMEEMETSRQTFVLNRGQYDDYGEEVHPNTPSEILPWPVGLPKNRLGLAKWLFLTDHPLTARVVVNRYWQMIFGKGLVTTAEDFGNQGAIPSHPALLDWLANYFVDSGWDVKKLIKLLVSSATYRQSSELSEHILALDPENIWLSRGPNRRLSSEMIRNNALSASGLLNPAIGGPSVKPYQPKGLWKINNTVYERDTGSSLHRRSLYTYWKRTVPNPTQAIFDAPDRSECTVRRQETNTPLQALVLMNDPAYLESAKVIGEQITMASNLRKGIRDAFTRLAGRFPEEGELETLLEIQAFEYEKYRSREKKPVGLLSSGAYLVDPTLDQDAFYANAVLANVLICSESVVRMR